MVPEIAKINGPQQSRPVQKKSKSGKMINLNQGVTLVVSRSVAMDIYSKEFRAEEVQELLDDLKSASDTKHCCALYNWVTYITTHENWFDYEQRAQVAGAAQASLGLTKKQKKSKLLDVRKPYIDDYGWGRQYDYF